MVRELGHAPHFRGARWATTAALGHISLYIALIQISVVMADKIDTTVLGFVLSAPGPATAVYDVVSKPFFGAPPDRLDAGLLRDAGGRQPDGRATIAGRAGQVMAPGCTSACCCPSASWR